MRMEKCGWKIANHTMQMINFFRCLPFIISKFPMQKTGIVKLGEALLQLHKRAIFPCLHIGLIETRGGLFKTVTLCANKRCHRGFAELSRILPAPWMLRWGSLNMDKVFYCSCKMISTQTQRQVNLVEVHGQWSLIYLSNKEVWAVCNETQQAFENTREM